MMWPLSLQITPKDIDTAAQSFRTAKPFPHVVLDDWFVPAVLNDVTDLFTMVQPWQSYEDGKRGTSAVKDHPFFQAMNSELMLELLKAITGDVLVPDPTMRGGGLHAVQRGGRLGIHVDFNRHPQLPLARRLNTILYLNPTWQEDWHGQLTLTDRKGAAKVIAPSWNRWVIFRYGPESWHGHPEPLTCPEDVERRSVAMYYYQPLTEDVAFTGTHYA